MFDSRVYILKQAGSKTPVLTSPIFCTSLLAPVLMSLTTIMVMTLYCGRLCARFL